MSFLSAIRRTFTGRSTPRRTPINTTHPTPTTDPTMPDDDNKPDAPAALTAEAIAKLINDGVAAATRPLVERVEAIQQAEQQRAEAAAAAAKPDAEKQKPDGPLTVESVGKLVADALAADRNQQAEQAGRQQARQATVNKLVADKLGGDASLASLLTADDEAGLARQAEAMSAKLDATRQAARPDLPGTRAEGGSLPSGQTGSPPARFGLLTPGQSKLAESLKAATAPAQS